MTIALWRHMLNAKCLFALVLVLQLRIWGLMQIPMYLCLCGNNSSCAWPLACTYASVSVSVLCTLFCIPNKNQMRCSNVAFMQCVTDLALYLFSFIVSSMHVRTFLDAITQGSWENVTPLAHASIKLWSIR